MRGSERLKVLAAGYAVVLTFTIALLAIHWLGEKPLEDSLSPTLTIVFAAIAAAPVALAFIWDRLSRVKVFDVEIALNDVSAERSARLAEEIQEIQRQAMGPSLMPEILKRITEAIDESAGIKVLEVHLGHGESWWATRLYLLAALAADYTSIQNFVFLSDANGPGNYLVGISEPREVQKVLGNTYAFIEDAYRQSKQGIAGGWPPSKDEIEAVIQNFGMQLFGLKPPELQDDEPVLNSPGVREWVTPEFAKRSFSAEHAIVDWSGGPETAMLRYRILDRPTPFVFLVENSKLTKVVDRAELAVRIAKKALGESITGT
jgi:hypothetical protein